MLAITGRAGGNSPQADNTPTTNLTNCNINIAQTAKMMSAKLRRFIAFKRRGVAYTGEDNMRYIKQVTHRLCATIKVSKLPQAIIPHSLKSERDCLTCPTVMGIRSSDMPYRQIKIFHANDLTAGWMPSVLALPASMISLIDFNQNGGAVC